MKYILESVEFGKYIVFNEDKITERERSIIEKWITKSASKGVYKDDGYYYYSKLGNFSTRRCDDISEIPKIVVEKVEDLKNIKKYNKEFIKYLIDNDLFKVESLKYFPYQSEELVDIYIEKHIKTKPNAFAYIENPTKDQIIRSINLNHQIIKYCDKDLLTEDLIEMAESLGAKIESDSPRNYSNRANIYGKKLNREEKEELRKYLSEWAVSRVTKYNGLYYYINDTWKGYTSKGFENLKDIRFAVVRSQYIDPLKPLNDLKHVLKIDKEFIRYLDKIGIFNRDIIENISPNLRNRELYDYYMEKFGKENPKFVTKLRIGEFDQDRAIELNPKSICYFPITLNMDGKLVGITEDKLKELVNKAINDDRFDLSDLKYAHDILFHFIDEDFAIQNIDKCPYLIKSLSEEKQTEEIGEMIFNKLNLTNNTSWYATVGHILGYIKKIPENVLIKNAREFIHTYRYLRLYDKLKTPKFIRSVIKMCREDEFLQGNIFDLPKEYLNSEDYKIALSRKIIRNESNESLTQFFNRVPSENKKDVLELIFKNKRSLLYHIKINDKNKDDFKWLVDNHPESLKDIRKNRSYSLYKDTINVTKPIKEQYSEEQDGDILYIFDFDDTLVKTPRFEDLAIPLLEKVSIEDMLKISCRYLDVSISDLKHENGRIYVDDPNEKKEIKGNWVRKKKRVYLLAPNIFHLSDESFPSKLKKISKLYKEVENKAIVTGRPSGVKGKVIKSLLELGLDLPRFGVHCYPLDDVNSDRVATWKAKKIIQLIKKTEIYNVKFYDDNRKWIRKVKEIVTDSLPHVKLDTIRIY